MVKFQIFRFTENDAIREIYAALVVYHASLVEGFDTTFSAYIVTGYEGVTTEYEALTGSLHILFFPFGCIMSMLIVDRFGRKRSIQLRLLVHIIAWLLLLFSASDTVVYIGRSLSGVASGLRVSSIYVSEISHESRRGKLLCLIIPTILFGSNVSLIVSYYHNWELIASLALIVSVLGLIQLQFIPESKYWYLSKGRRDKAKESLLWFSRNITPEEVNLQLNSIQRSFLVENRGDVIQSFCKHLNLRLFLVAASLRILLSGCGRMAILMHIEHFFRTFQATYDSKKLVVGLGFAEFTAGCLYLTIAEKFKRKTILNYTLSLLAFCLVSILIYDLILCRMNISVPIFPVIMICIYLMLVLTGLVGSVSVITIEMMTGNNRGFNLGLLNIVHTVAAGIYSSILPYVFNLISIPVILFFLLLNVIAMAFVSHYFAPETGGKALHECIPSDTEDNVIYEKLLPADDEL